MIDILEYIEPKAQKRHRFARGHVYDPSAKDKRELLKVMKKHSPAYPIDEPVSIEFEFGMKRPKSHFGTGKNANKLKPSAPEYHTKKPDVDNIIKLVFDALNGEFWTDDSVIDEIVARKVWAYDEPYIKMLVVEPEDTQ